MAKKTRKSFLHCVETLEGRALLSGLTLHMPSIKVHGTHVTISQHRTKHTKAIITDQPMITALSTQSSTGAVNTKTAALNAGLGNNRIKPVASLPFVAPVRPLDGSSTRSFPVSYLPPGTLQTASIGTAATITATPAVTTTTTASDTPLTPVTATSIAPGALVTNVSSSVPGPFGATLNATEVASFKSAVDTFAANYTSGANATQDTAAANAMNSALSDVALSTWSRGNVVSQSAVSAFQSAVSSFASSYTSGTNATQDVAAWKSLQSAMSALGNSLGGTSTASATPGIYKLTAMPDPSMNYLFGLSSVGTLSAADVASLKTAVDTFATNYTSGTDTTADSNANSTLETALSNIATKYMQATPLTTVAATTNSPTVVKTTG